MITLSRKLVPLGIPSGWAVIFNLFVEFFDDEAITCVEAEKYLSDDILSIEQIRLTEGRWMTDAEGWLVDLGWRDPGDPNGQYVLSAVRGGWDNPAAVLRNRSCRVIREAIELTFQEIIEGSGTEELSEAFRKISGSTPPRMVTDL